MSWNVLLITTAPNMRKQRQFHAKNYRPGLIVFMCRPVLMPRRRHILVCLLGAVLSQVAANRSCAGSPPSAELIRLAVAARKAQEEILLARALHAKVHVERPGSKVAYDIDLRCANWKWRANVTYRKSEQFPLDRVMREFANNGFEFTELNRWTGQGLIGKPDVVLHQSGYLAESIDLPTEYWLTLRGELISNIMEDAADRMTLLDGSSSKELHIRVPFGPAGPHHFRLRLTAAYNYAIVDADWCIDDFKISRRMRAHKFDELAPGAWMPRAWSIGSAADGDKKGFSGEPRTYVCSEAALEDAIDNNLFRIDFPVGTVVANNITGDGFQVGRPPGSKGIDRQLLMKVRELPLSKPPAPLGQTSAKRWFFLLNAVAAIAFIFYLRGRRRRWVRARK